MISKTEVTPHDITIRLERPGLRPDLTLSVVPRDDGSWFFHFSGLGDKRVNVAAVSANQIEVTLIDRGD